jgi:hypothetical protein
MDQAKAAIYSDRADFEGGDSCRVFLAILGEEIRAGVGSLTDRNFWEKLGNLKGQEREFRRACVPIMYV